MAILGLLPVRAQTAGGPITLDQILDGIERRYDGKGFTAAFFQESMLKAVQITDTAEGRLTVKRPGKMRWEYTIPEAQSIITDGHSMWIHRPADNQVMVGKAPEYFGGGKGAGFLSDIRQVRKSFTIQMQAAENQEYYRLKLIPVKPTPELADIVISAAKGTFQIDQVVTHNSYGDETRIVLSNYQFNIDPDDAQFTFTIPKGADVVKMDKF
jgi:outer membrane lipoprotein carrier protein